MLGIAGNVRI